MTSQVVVLTISEIQIAATIGATRQIESMRQGLKDSHGYNGNETWDVHIEGAAAELAFCKFRGRYWNAPVNNFKEADVGQNVQVRATKYNNGSLIVRKGDNDDHYYILLTGRVPNFRVVGWITGAEAKNPDWLETKGNSREPAYFVPQSALNGFS